MEIILANVFEGKRIVLGSLLLSVSSIKKTVLLKFEMITTWTVVGLWLVIVTLF